MSSALGRKAHPWSITAAAAVILHLGGGHGTAAEPVSVTTVTAGQQERSAVEERIRSERATKDSSFVITPHRPNYLLPIVYNWSLNKAA
jgi:hypothetical protein